MSLDTSSKSHIYNDSYENITFKPLSEYCYDQEMEVFDKYEPFEWLNTNTVGNKFNDLTINETFDKMYKHFVLERKILDSISVFYYISEHYELDDKKTKALFESLSYNTKKLLIKDLILSKYGANNKELLQKYKNFSLDRKKF